MNLDRGLGNLFTSKRLSLVGYFKKANANLVFALYAFIKLFTINAVDKKVFGKLKIA